MARYTAQCRARCTKAAQYRARCTKAAQCSKVHQGSSVQQGVPRQLSAGQGAPRQLSAARCTTVVAGPGRPGGVCTTGIARASASGQLPQRVRHMASCVQTA